MAVTVLHRLKTCLVLRLVTTQDKNILNAKELKVEQHVLDVLFGHTAHHHMRHHFDAILLHDGTRHSHSTWTAAHKMTQVGAVRLFHIHILTSMSRDVDIFWTELLQRINRAEKSRRACPLHWWQHLEGEGSLFVLID